MGLCRRDGCLIWTMNQGRPFSPMRQRVPVCRRLWPRCYPYLDGCFPYFLMPSETGRWYLDSLSRLSVWPRRSFVL